jgi:anionic cell wall polymer biosynthesis LytR-Cps2A-Psr (LCP) family protein
MDGAKALAYSRERYAYTTGDRHRGQNQQQVITAIVNKISQNKSYLLKYTDILESIQPCFATNVELEDIQGMVREQIDSLAPWTVESISVNGTNSNNYTYSFPKQYTYVMVPDQATIDAAKARINQVMRES